MEFEREPDNPADPNAMKVLIPGGTQLGYLGRELAADLVTKIDEGFKYALWILEVTGQGRETLGINLLVLEVAPDVTDSATIDNYMTALADYLAAIRR